MNVYISYLSIVIFFWIPEFRIYLREFHQQIWFFYWIEDSKPYAQADA